MTRKNIWRRVLSMMLAIVLVCGSAATGAVPVNAADIPAGYTAIYTAAQLNDVRNNLSGKYILMNNIDISGFENWEPIGSEYWNNSFTGILDGGDHRITGMKINLVSPSEALVAGLFGIIAGGQVKNLGVAGTISITATASYNLVDAGGVVGWIRHNCATIV
jgi:hypothetical protein